ncbi:DUF7373 family lipoprotein [Nocardia jiangsuensis]|uniref:Uncharacterized protein n=1 Tax=Nocardia jiangsuensis TaxID=1691563 RepID=A0ABV8DY36_9NOCA
MVNRRRGLCAALLAAVVAVTAGCGTGDSAAPARPEVDLAALDVGNLPTEPKTYTKPTSLDMARIVEAMRLGDHLPLPMEIDPEVTHSAMNAPVRMFTSMGGTAIGMRLYAPASALDPLIRGFVTGFVTAGRSEVKPELSYELDNLALLFESEQDAASAADAFTEVERSALGPETEIQPIAGFPEARAHTDRSRPGSIHSFYAVGKFLLFTHIDDNVMRELQANDADKLRARVARSIEKMKPALESYVPTPVDKLMELDVDPTGMLGRTLNTLAIDQNQFGIPGVFDRHGGLQIGMDPGLDAESFERAGVDAVAWVGNFLYRTRDAAAAEQLLTERAEPSRFFRRAAPPANLPFAQCLEYIGAASAVGVYCGVTFGRYTAEVTARQLLDAQQRIAAQYAILAKTN